MVAAREKRKHRGLARFCGKCGQERHFLRAGRDVTVNVRGERITARISEITCPVCGNTQPDPAAGADPMAAIYDEYRRKHQMLSPREIAGIREQNGLSREAFAKILGMSPATLYRYEGGALQDDVHDLLIGLCRDQKNMQKIVARHRNRLTKLQLRRFESAIANGVAGEGGAQGAARAGLHK